MWVTALVTAGYVVYAINPLAASRYRDRHNVGGPKSDPGDAKMLADLVRTDRHLHRRIAGDTPEAEAIRIMARGHQNLIWTRTRQTNALWSCGPTRQRTHVAGLYYTTLATGAHTVKVQADATTSTCNIVGTAAAPHTLIVTDVGPS